MSAIEDAAGPRAETGPASAAAEASGPAAVSALPVRTMIQPAFRILFDLSLVPMALLVLSGRFGDKDWLFDMTNFFRPHIAAVALVFVVVALAGASMPRLAIAILLLAAALYPLLVPSAAMAPAAPAGNLRVMTANVNGRNEDGERFARLVAAEAPDVLVVQEAGTFWRDVIANLAALPYVTPVRGTSVVVASRYPLDAQIVDLGPGANPTPNVGGSTGIRVELTRPGAARPLVLYAVHAPTTRNASGWLRRWVYLFRTMLRVAAEPKGTDVLVAGDWNTPYWSPSLSTLLGVGRLRTTERGAWPPSTRFFREFGAPPALGTPIDRIAVSSGIGVAAIHVSPDFGSDHLAVTADLAIP